MPVPLQVQCATDTDNASADNGYAHGKYPKEPSRSLWNDERIYCRNAVTGADQRIDIQLGNRIAMIGGKRGNAADHVSQPVAVHTWHSAKTIKQACALELREQCQSFVMCDRR